MAGLNFDATNVPQGQAFENLTPGWYTVRMVESEMKPTSTNTGSYLECQFEVIAPAQFAGRKLWDRLNLNNPNPKTVEIANETLSAICHSVGIIQVQDSQQLHNCPLDAKVGMSKVTEQYPEPRNEIKGYRKVQGATGQAAPMQQQAPQQFQQQAPQQYQQAPQQQNFQQPMQQMQHQPVQQQAPVQQQQQQFQQPVYQQAVQQQAPAQTQQVQQQAPVHQQPPQPDSTQQQAPQQQVQQQQVQQQAPVQEVQIQQAATDPNAQQAAQTGKAPWQV